MAPVPKTSDVFTIFDIPTSSRTKIAWAPRLIRQNAVDLDEVPVTVLSVDRIESEHQKATVTLVDEVDTYAKSTSNDNLQIYLDMDSKTSDCDIEDLSSIGSLISVKEENQENNKTRTLCSFVGLEMGILSLVTSVTLTGAFLIVLCL